LSSAMDVLSSFESFDRSDRSAIAGARHGPTVFARRDARAKRAYLQKCA
jgi:hypothetical protein